jgi:LysR family glycine cleavage system transcriptional activator
MVTSRPLPPISLLVAFEAACRHLSFKEAARELHVTPSAVSQQIKQLETALGVSLFERRPRGVELSEAGALYFAVAQGVIERFRHGTELLLSRHGPHPLRLNAAAEVAYEVLIPSLGDFERRHPELDLRIETGSALIDLRADSVDATVRYGSGPWDGHASTPVADTTAAVVAAPALLQRAPLERTEDLRKHTLLYVHGAPDYWSALSNAVGFEIRKKKAFDSYLATLQAAVHGAGVALGLFPLSAAWIRDGRICTPLADRYPSSPYHFVTRPEDADRPEFVLVREWIRGCFRRLAEDARAP